MPSTRSGLTYDTTSALAHPTTKKTRSGAIYGIPHDIPVRVSKVHAKKLPSQPHVGTGWHTKHRLGRRLKPTGWLPGKLKPQGCLPILAL